MNKNWDLIHIKHGTIKKIFSTLSISSTILHDILNTTQANIQLSHLHSGHKLHVLISPGNKFKAFKLQLSNIKTLHINYTEQGYRHT